MYPKLLKRLEEWIRQGKVQSFYHTKEWRRLRRIALIRDNRECQNCKEDGLCTRNALEVHHLEEVRLRPEKALELSNLKTLCIKCHNKEHDRGARGRKKREKYPECW